MKYLTKFSIISALVVSAGGCQTNPDNPFDPPAEPVITPVQVREFTLRDVQLAVPPATDDSEDASALVTAAPAIDPEGALSTPDLWARLRRGLVLDHHLDQRRVKAELDWFVRHPEYLDRVAARASKHLYHIVEAVEERGLPMEIALLPVVESAFDPFAYSHGRASGLWQFIPGTAGRFGLAIDYWYDGRRDVPEATRAALDYLELLHRYLGDDWLRALAAYNSGEGNVSYSVRKNERAGKAIDFWSLDLPRETEGYVPRLLALSALVANPGKYGITLKSIADEPYWEMAETGGQIDLARAAELAGISTEELYLLNPAFNKWSTRPEGPHRILLPVGKASVFTEALAALPPTERLRWIRHEIRPGESLGVIARRYHTSVSALKATNQLTSNLIRAGDALLIPMASRPAADYELSDSERLKDRQIKVAEATGLTPSTHTVARGDSFWKLSRRYGVSMRQLAKWNGMATTDPLFPGQKLKIFTVTAVATTATPPSPEGIIRKINYRVRRGESLALIANRFNLSVQEIKKWNSRVARQKYLQPGDRITLYIDITNTD